MLNVSVSEARGKFAEILDRVGHGKERIAVGDEGAPLAVLVPVEDLKRLENQAEAALRESEALLRQAAEMADLGHWVWDELADKCIYCSEMLAQMNGVTVEEYPARFDTMEALLNDVHPDDRARYEQVIRDAKRDAVPYDIEFRDAMPGGGFRYLRERGEPILDDDGKVVRTVGTLQDVTDYKRTEEALRRARDELEIRVEERTAKLRKVNESLSRQITARKRVEAVLRESEARLAKAAKIAKVGYWVWDEIEDKAAYCSDEMAEICGVATGRELTAMVTSTEKDAEWVHPADRGRFDQLMRQTKAEKTAYDTEYRIVRPDGQVRYLRDILEPVLDEQGNLVRSNGIVQDITARKHAEQAVRESEARFRDYAEASADWFWEMDADLRFTYMSENVERFIEVAPEWHYGKTREDLLGDDYDRDAWAEHLKALRERKPFRNFEYLRTGDGVKPVWLRASGVPIFAEDGAFLGYRGTGSDITEKKRVEEELRESEERFRDYAEASADWFWEMDADLRFTYMSPNVERMVGVPPEWHYGKTRKDLLGKDYDRETWEEHLQTLRAQKPFRDFTYFRVGEETEPRWLRTSGIPVFADDGSFLGYRGSGSDVTATVLAAQAVRESEARYRELFEESPIGIWVEDWSAVKKMVERLARRRVKDWRKYLTRHPDRFDELYDLIEITDVSRASLELFRAPDLAALDALFQAGLAPEDEREAVFETLLAFLAGGASHEFEAREKRCDGTEMITHSRVVVLPEHRNDWSRVVYAIEDVTERRRAEEALRESEERFSKAFQSSPSLMAIAGVKDGKIYDVNDNWCSTMGFTRDEAIGKTGFEIGIWVDPSLRTSLVAALEKEESVRDLEFPFQTKGGEVRDFHVAVERIELDAGPRLLIVSHDITERKKIAEELARNEERLRQATELAGLGYWVWDAVEDRCVYCSEEHARIHGLSVEEYIERAAPLEGEFSFVYPEDREKVQDLFKALRNGDGFDVEYRLITPAAETRFVREIAKPVFDKTGTVVQEYGTIQDITDQKRVEEEIRKLNAELEQRVEERTVELRAAQAELLRQERLATLGQLTATVSHELRNPLGVIRTSAFVVRDGLDEAPARVARSLERIERSVIRCDRIIDEMLDFTRISELEFETTPIDTWLAGVLEEQVVPRGVTVHNEFALPGVGVGLDRDRLRRAVINVFDNACQAMIAGASERSENGEHRLTVRTGAAAGRIELVFEDTGPGILPEVLPKVFEPLFSTKGFGVGLGLSVVHQIMEQHGGGIEIENIAGGGARVRLWLPGDEPGP